MGTDCGLLIKVKGEERKYYRRSFDRLYCFERISIGPDFEIEHEGLKDHNELIGGRRGVRTTDEIKWDHAVQWAKERIAFLNDNRASIQKEGDPFLRVDYHLRWVTDFLQTLWSISGWDPFTKAQTPESNIQTLWLAADNGETYDDIVFNDENAVIDLEIKQ